MKRLFTLLLGIAFIFPLTAKTETLSEADARVLVRSLSAQQLKSMENFKKQHNKVQNKKAKNRKATAKRLHEKLGSFFKTLPKNVKAILKPIYQKARSQLNTIFKKKPNKKKKAAAAKKKKAAAAKKKKAAAAKKKKAAAAKKKKAAAAKKKKAAAAKKKKAAAAKKKKAEAAKKKKAAAAKKKKAAAAKKKKAAAAKKKKAAAAKKKKAAAAKKKKAAAAKKKKAAAAKKKKAAAAKKKKAAAAKKKKAAAAKRALSDLDDLTVARKSLRIINKNPNLYSELNQHLAAAMREKIMKDSGLTADEVAALPPAMRSLLFETAVNAVTSQVRQLFNKLTENNLHTAYYNMESLATQSESAHMAFTLLKKSFRNFLRNHY